MKRTVSAGALAVATLLATACAPTTPTPEPVPQPTLQCTPEAGGEAYPCDQTTHDRMTARDAQYAEAERIYRRNIELQYQLAEQRQPINDELRNLLTGEYLDGITNELLDAAADDVSISGTPEVVWVRREPNSADQGSILTLHACHDAGTTTLTYQGTTQPGASYAEYVYYQQVDGTLRIASNRISQVAQC